MSSSNTAIMVGIESLAEKYEGEAKLQRLLFWSSHSELSKAEQQQSVRMALEYIQGTGGHYDTYERILEIGDAEKAPSDFVQKQQLEDRAQLSVLETRLSASKSQLHKDSIRSAYLALARFRRSKGSTQEALRDVLRSRDYCTDRTQTGQVCLLVIELAIELHKWSLVREYVNKAQHASLDASDESKLPVASGLAHLMEGQYSEACIAFQNVKQQGSPWRNVVAPEDVATYAALLALSELSSRDQLVSFLDTSPHLELQPRLQLALREFVIKANYKYCFDTLRDMSGVMKLDIYLQPHLRELSERIWQRSIVDYTRPFCKLSIPTLCTTLGWTTDTERMTKTLVGLIGEGKLPHRLNLRSQTLEYDNDKIASMQQATQKKLALVEESVLNDVYSMMVRLACLENHTLGERREGGGWEESHGAAGRGDVIMSDGDDDDDDDDADNPFHHMAIAAANPDDDEML